MKTKNIKIRKTCGFEGNVDFFHAQRKKNNTFYYYPNCKKCAKPKAAQRNKKWYSKNKDAILSKSRIRYSDTIGYQQARCKKYREKNI